MPCNFDRRLKRFNVPHVARDVVRHRRAFGDGGLHQVFGRGVLDIDEGDASLLPGKLPHELAADSGCAAGDERDAAGQARIASQIGKSRSRRQCKFAGFVRKSGTPVDNARGADCFALNQGNCQLHAPRPSFRICDPIQQQIDGAFAHGRVGLTNSGQRRRDNRSPRDIVETYHRDIRRHMKAPTP